MTAAICIINLNPIVTYNDTITDRDGVGINTAS